MLKMFTTQLTGLLKRMEEKEEFSFEDGARLLAQALVGDGHIYIVGTKEMKAVELEATLGAEPFSGGKALQPDALDELTDADRAIVFSRFSTDEDALAVARQLVERGILFVGVSTIVDEPSGESLADLADVHVDLRLKKGLLPDDVGNRFGYPSSIAALFAYYGLKFTIDEIMTEYED